MRRQQRNEWSAAASVGASTEREADFQADVLELAGLTGWLSYHAYDSRRNAAGWPDLALVKPPRLLLVELKTTRGRLRPEQRVWLTALSACPGVEVAVWRPRDWPMIERALIHGERLRDFADSGADGASTPVLARETDKRLTGQVC